MGEQIRVYSAAALFSGREALFNAHLVSGLEEKGYSVFSPQRDGLEFGILGRALEKELPSYEVTPAVYTIIYLLDIGLLIPRSQVIIANFDEPLDEGVVVETTYARIMGKPVIGFRTDSRSPYGTISDLLGGVHGFAAYQCNTFSRHCMPCENTQEAEAQMQVLVDTIDDLIQNTEITPSNLAPRDALLNKHILSVMETAETLFKDIPDIHSEQGLEEISQRCVQHMDELKKVSPAASF